MPALVKANSNLVGGNVALVSYAFRDSSDLTVTIDAEFCALSGANVDALFRIGSTIPPALRQASGFAELLTQKRVQDDPALTSCEVVIANGLKRFVCSYVSRAQAASGDSAADSGQEVSLSTDLRSFSGSSTAANGVSNSFSFDYYATTATIEYNNPSAAPSGPPEEVKLSTPFNAQGTLPTSYQEPPGGILVGDALIPFIITTSRQTRNNVGQTRYTITYSVQYIYVTGGSLGVEGFA